jgi:7,8-dihydropterin-6-yl-methyl-4-(beta-D-ribofuranosyl)aminobenzene 5'-phosphate synthase
MRGKILITFLLASIALTVLVHLALNIDYSKGDEFNVVFSKMLEIGVVKKVVLTIIYDNNPYDERLKTGWGFGCYINVDGTGILFDTGGDPSILLENMAKLNINVKDIEIIVLSHIHGDHVGGLFGSLEVNSQVKVYMPASFPSDFKQRVREYRCEVIEVTDALKICNGVATTGELGTVIKEQSLIISTMKGLFVVTGCAHPGVTGIVKKAEELTGMVVYLVLGGFHLSGESEKTISAIIEEFRALEVVKVAPCHCSGNLARSLFKEGFEEDYIEVGVGSDS